MMPNATSLNILDCTLRDGSYVIDYQFTPEDTYVICLGLARAGFKYIEIGHGLGMGDFPRRKGRAAAGDAEYLEAARAALASSDAQYGMFFIPGIGNLDDLDVAARCGMKFVRIGTDVNSIAKAEPFIRRAKELGMFVFSNLMKSYAVTIDEFKTFAKKADDYGADVIVVVDSAGGMMPEDVAGYIQALKSVTSKAVGFHGHNNLQMAMANTLAAVDAGATFIDSSLQGMGRSAGNTQTEVLVMVLEKLGYATGINPYDTMDMGKRIVKTMTHKDQGVDDISLVAGIAQFHSGFFELVDDAAQRYGIDPRRLMLEVSEINRVTVTKELTEQTAQRIASSETKNADKRPDVLVNANVVSGQAFETSEEKTQILLKDVVSLSRKTGKESVFSLTISKTGKETLPFIRQSPSLIMVNIEAWDLSEVESIIADVDGHVNWILLDESCHELRESSAVQKVAKSFCAWYSEDRVLLQGACTFLAQKSLKGDVLVLADDKTADVFLLLLRQQGLRGMAVSDESLWRTSVSAGEISAVVSFGKQYAAFLNRAAADLLAKDVLICSARPGSFPAEFWNAVVKSGLVICRIDARAALASELNLVIETSRNIRMMGARTLDGVAVVSGGVIGARGHVVVDSVNQPGKVIGVCDGEGGLLSIFDEKPYKEQIEKVRAVIIKRLYR